MPTILWIIIFGFLMSGIAFAGGLLLFLGPALVDRLILPLIAFAAGSLIGGALLHMIPHAVEEMGNTTALYVWLLAGFVLFLALEQFLAWHHSHTHSHSCGPGSPPHQHRSCPPLQTRNVQEGMQRQESLTHVIGLDFNITDLNMEEGSGDSTTIQENSPTTFEQVELGDAPLPEEQQGSENDAVNPETDNNPSTRQANSDVHERQNSRDKESLGYLILIADAVHNFLGGLFVGASFVDSVELGLSAWYVSAAHELPQELGDFAILVHGGWSYSHALLWNFLSGLTFPLGGILAYASSKTSDISFLIPFAAGNFLYIGCTDLIPEVKHYHGLKPNILHFASFMLGVGILLIIRVAVEGW